MIWLAWLSFWLAALPAVMAARNLGLYRRPGEKAAR